MYEIFLERRVISQLKKIPKPDYLHIKKQIFQLASNPRPSRSIKLKGRNAYRIRWGNYRIIYEIKDKVLVVLIIDVGHRKNIYRK